MARRMPTLKEIKAAGGISPESLATVLEGSDSVVVDLNVEGDKLQVRLDSDYIHYLHKIKVTVDGGDYFILNCINSSSTPITSYNTITAELENITLTGKCRFTFFPVPEVYREYILMAISSSGYDDIVYAGMQRTSNIGSWEPVGGIVFTPTSVTDTVIAI